MNAKASKSFNLIYFYLIFNVQVYGYGVAASRDLKSLDYFGLFLNA